MTFSSNYKYDFSYPRKKDLKREIRIQNHHNDNNALFSARLMLPLSMCILNTFNNKSSRHLHPKSENETEIYEPKYH